MNSTDLVEEAPRIYVGRLLDHLEVRGHARLRR